MKTTGPETFRELPAEAPADDDAGRVVDFRIYYVLSRQFKLSVAEIRRLDIDLAISWGLLGKPASRRSGSTGGSED